MSTTSAIEWTEATWNPVWGDVTWNPVLACPNCSAGCHDDYATAMGRRLKGGALAKLAGGDSGAGARPKEAAWLRSVRNKCQAVGVPFFFKQWGGRNKKTPGRTPHVRTWRSYCGGCHGPCVRHRRQNAVCRTLERAWTRCARY
jgi:protein gp37